MQPNPVDTTNCNIHLATSFSAGREIAEQINGMIEDSPGSSGGAFNTFSLSAISSIAGALLYTRKTVSTKVIHQELTQGGLENLVTALETYAYDCLGPGYTNLLDFSQTSDRVQSLINLYEIHLQVQYPSTDIEDLVGILRMDSDYFNHATASILPAISLLSGNQTSASTIG